MRDWTPTEHRQRKFWDKVEFGHGPGACWTWRAALDNHGYGRFNVGREGGYRVLGAHGLAYRLLVGEVRDGLELDHLCRNRACVNPAHLEPVPHKTNMARGAWSAKTHCPRGHPYSGGNLHVATTGSRSCRACRAAGEMRRVNRFKHDPEFRRKRAEANRRYRARMGVVT